VSLNTKTINEVCLNKKIVRGIQPLHTSVTTLRQLIDACFAGIKYHTKKNKNKVYEETWKCNRVLNVRTAQKNFKKIPRYHKLIEQIVINLQNHHPLKIVYTTNIGPEYVYSDSDAPDTIHIPYPHRFSKNKYFYKTFIHELAHAACSRRRLFVKFLSPDIEEVAVESVALIISFLLGVNVWEDSLEYITDRAYYHQKPLIKNYRQWSLLHNKTKKMVLFLLTGRERLRESIISN